MHHTIKLTLNVHQKKRVLCRMNSSRSRVQLDNPQHAHQSATALLHVLKSCDLKQLDVSGLLLFVCVNLQHPHQHVCPAAALPHARQRDYPSASDVLICNVELTLKVCQNLETLVMPPFLDTRHVTTSLSACCCSPHWCCFQLFSFLILDRKSINGLDDAIQHITKQANLEQKQRASAGHALILRKSSSIPLA